MTEPAITSDGRTYYDLETVLATLREIVAEQPDFCYEPTEDGDCFYAVEEGGVNNAPVTLAPSCGVGHVFHRLNPELLAFAHRFDPGIEDRSTGLRARAVTEAMAGQRFGDDGIEVIFDARAVRLLNRFQAMQDIREPWRECLTEAEADSIR